MNIPDQLVSSDTQTAHPSQQTSIGIKLPLIVIGLMLFAFLVYTFISIRISQGSLTENLKQDMQADTQTKTELIQNVLADARSIATNLATAVESGEFSEVNLSRIIQNTLTNNELIFGSTVAYEPYQFQSDLYYWAPYYYRAADDTLKFTQLGNPEYDYLNQAWYTQPKQSQSPILSAPYFDEGGGDIWMVTWSIPFQDQNNNIRGIATADIDFSLIQQILQDTELGRAGYAFLIDSNGLILGISDNTLDLQEMTDSMVKVGQSNTTINWDLLINNMINGETGFMEATDINGNLMFISYAPIGFNTGWSLGLVYPRDEVLQQTTALQTSLVGYSFLSALVFGIVIYYFTRTITNPLRQLTTAASLIATENPENAKEVLRNPINIQTQDELEELANAFNQMASNINQLVEGLEEKVKDRTSELEDARLQSERRVTELQSISEISKVIAGEQKLQILLPLIARLVSERFGFYHTGIFLLDETNRYAILQAASSEGGKIMLAHGHKLEVGGSGIVGHVAQSGAPRIALDVGQDAIYFDNPYLPDTHSEMSLPLIVRNKISGVLDLQSTKKGAFTEVELNTMSILADQIAIAIENARLFQQAQIALTETESLYRQNIQENWLTFSREEPVIGYQQTLTSGRMLESPIESDETRMVMNSGRPVISSGKNSPQEQASIVIPIKLRNQVIGTLRVQAPEEGRSWTKDEVNLAEIVSERLSLAIENARLIQESQSQASKEQIISDIAAKIGASVRTENILRITASELSQLLDDTNIYINLNTKTESKETE